MMKNKILLYLLSVGALFFGPIVASATITTLYANPASPSEWLEIPLVADWATSSATMAGMRVTATFYDGRGPEVLSWGEDLVTGGVSGSGWSLFMQNPTGNTLSNGFTLEATGQTDIMSLLLEGAPGETMFDVEPRIGVYSTDGSRDGVPVVDSYLDAFLDTMYPVSYSGIDIDASYLTPIALTGLSPVYDLYSSLLLSFTNTDPNNGLGFTSDSLLTFISDTDNVGQPVPEPATMLLFAGGLVGLFGARWGRKK